MAEHSRSDLAEALYSLDPDIPVGRAEWIAFTCATGILECTAKAVAYQYEGDTEGNPDTSGPAARTTTRQARTYGHIRRPPYACRSVWTAERWEAVIRAAISGSGSSIHPQILANERESGSSGLDSPVITIGMIRSRNIGRTVGISSTNVIKEALAIKGTQR
jgi:hypothetical protein